MTIKTIKLLLLLGLFTTFSACKGQNNDKNKEPHNDAIKLGTLVSELDEKIWAIYQDSKNNMWFGGNKKRVFKYDGERLILYTNKDGLIGSNILGIQEDRVGNIYFDTSEGVIKFDGQQFTALEVAENSAVKNDWKLEPNDLWFRMGWNNSGPYRFDGEYLYHLQFPKNEMENEFNSKYPNASFNPYGIYYIYKDTKGSIWFGTSSLGVYHFDGNDISWMYEKHLTETPEGGSFGIRSIIEDKDGYIWICNPKYKYKILSNSAKTNELKQINYQRELGVKNRKIENLYSLSMALDNNGGLWMATYDDGVWRSNENELIHYPIKDGDIEALLFSIYKDNEGVLWIATQNAGVYKFNGDTFEKFELLKQ
jgi:ligand-binding sensor domain-containing protein